MLMENFHKLKKNRSFTCETHESSFSGLLSQSLHVFVVDVNQVDGLQPECFGCHNHLLSGVQELSGIFSPCGTSRKWSRTQCFGCAMETGKFSFGTVFWLNYLNCIFLHSFKQTFCVISEKASGIVLPLTFFAIGQGQRKKQQLDCSNQKEKTQSYVWRRYRCWHRSRLSQTPHHHDEVQPWGQAGEIPRIQPAERMCVLAWNRCTEA